MFRATTKETPDGPVLKFEGRLIGAWVATAESAWHDSRAIAPAIAIDLRDVTSVDDGGTALLVRMHRAGSRLVVRGCFMRELLNEIDAEKQTADIQEETRA